MRQPLNKLVNDIRVFADRHALIETFLDNPLTDKAAKDIKFPLMFVDYGNGSSLDTDTVITLTLSIIDLLNNDRSNTLNIYSKTLKICDNVRTYFRQSRIELGWYINDNVTLTKTNFELTSNNAIGYTATIQLVVCNESNVDAIPLN